MQLTERSGAFVALLCIVFVFACATALLVGSPRSSRPPTPEAVNLDAKRPSAQRRLNAAPRDKLIGKSGLRLALLVLLVGLPMAAALQDASGRAHEAGDVGGEMAFDAAPPLVTAIANTAGVGPALPFLLGQFVLDDGRTMVLLQNQQVTYDALPVLSVDLSRAGARFLCEVSPLSGRETPLLSGFAIEAGSAA